MKFISRLAALGVVVAGVAAVAPLSRAAGDVWQLTLVGDVYHESGQAPKPTPGHPVYYFPLIGGFQALGARNAADTPPDARAIIRHLAKALYDQGYVVSRQVVDRTGRVTGLTPPPDLLMVIQWGVMRAAKLDMTTDVSAVSGPTGGGAAAPPPIVNRAQMIGLVAGKNYDNTINFGMGGEDVEEDIQYDRFFIMVSACQFNLDAMMAQRAGHKLPPLKRYWAAKLSVHADGTTMDVALPLLADHGGSVFGRETVGGQNLTLPAVPEGTVKVGTPTVKP